MMLKSGEMIEPDIIIDATGHYTIKGVIPGDYKIKYTWGEVDGKKTSIIKKDGTEKEISVQEYKGTNYIRNRMTENNEEFKPEEDPQWYKKDTKRYSDAIDDYATREEIDKDMKELTNSTSYNKNEIYSITPDMDIRIEYDDTDTNFTTLYEDENKDENTIGTFKIENVDFGIVERPRQEIKLDKIIKTLSVKLANGATLIDAKIEKDETGKYKLKDNARDIIYLPKDNSKGGLLKAEIDKELVQGSILSIQYGFLVKNISELDYVTKDYYTYGEINENTEKEAVYLEPKQIIDYMDNNELNVEKEEGWELQVDDAVKELFEKGMLEKKLEEDLKDVEKIYIKKVNGVKLQIGDESQEIATLSTQKIITNNTNNRNFENNAEIIQLSKNGGSKLISTPGNYNPVSAAPKENDSDISESVIISSATGEDRNYTTYIIIGIISLLIIAAGTTIIIKKVLI